MTKEALFEFAAEKGWDKILEAAYDVHDFSELAKKLHKKEKVLLVELRAMQALGLLALTQKDEKGSRYQPTIWGVKFMQEQNMKKGKTFSCLICGTTMGQPHICPSFYPEFR